MVPLFMVTEETAALPVEAPRQEQVVHVVGR
jgi:hypothetical protein